MRRVDAPEAGQVWQRFSWPDAAGPRAVLVAVVLLRAWPGGVACWECLFLEPQPGDATTRVVPLTASWRRLT